VVDRFGAAPEAALREQVARALMNKGFRLGELGRSEDEIRVYDSVVDRFGAAPEAALREQVARALVNKGITFGQLGRSEEAIATYDSVVDRFGAAAEAALREQVARALVNKGFRLRDAGRSGDAETSALHATTFASQDPGVWTFLGNVRLDFLGQPSAALDAYRKGIAAVSTAEEAATLNGNAGYAVLLMHGRAADVEHHVQSALGAGVRIAVPGRHLLQALVSAARPTPDWSAVFANIGKAVEGADPALWSDHIDDLQRILAFAILSGTGPTLRAWLDLHDYGIRFAPFYHAVVAALAGEDHLLQINPETRERAANIHAGIARLIRLYGTLDAAVIDARVRRGIINACHSP